MQHLCSKNPAAYVFTSPDCNNLYIDQTECNFTVKYKNSLDDLT